MYPELKTLLHEAEERYLTPPEIESVKRQATALTQRLAAYEFLRDQEVALFQPVADQLLEAFPQEKPERLERAVKLGLTTLRYCAMAMLQNNPEFLRRHLLEWLTDLVKVQQNQAIESTLYSLLQTHLQKHLSSEKLDLIQPFLDQAEQTLLGEDNAPVAIALPTNPAIAEPHSSAYEPADSHMESDGLSDELLFELNNLVEL